MINVRYTLDRSDPQLQPGMISLTFDVRIGARWAPRSLYTVVQTLKPNLSRYLNALQPIQVQRTA